MNPSYLYCFEASRGDIAKVGHTGKPSERMARFSTLPFTVSARHLIRLSDPRVASLWERKILNEANRFRDYGEWVVCDKHLDALFDRVPGTRVDLKMCKRTGRQVPPTASELLTEVKSLAKILTDVREMDGFCDELPYILIKQKIGEGWGVEDIHVQTDIPLDHIRKIVRGATASGEIYEWLGKAVPQVAAQ